MKIINVVGARPNFMKIAPIVEAMEAHNRRIPGSNKKIQGILVHTGQHYDAEMSELFFEDLGIPKPHLDLEVGSGSHAEQTAEIMKRFEPVLVREKPDAVLVVGDVNSTIACALTASKLGVKIIHVEAGLRSFDRTMPEEINRVLTDAISDLLFTTEKTATENLLREGIPAEKIFFVGNVMIDTLLKNAVRAKTSQVLENTGLRADRETVKPYAVLTLHRPCNVDSGLTLSSILEALKVVAERLPIIFPAHPRTAKNICEFKLNALLGSLREGRITGPGIFLLGPLGYLDFLHLMANSKLVLTDSGGIQEETTVLGIPCITLRENTERPVTLTKGTNRLAGTDRDRIISGSLSAFNGEFPRGRTPDLWDGRAAERIVRIISEKLPAKADLRLI